ncbi:hypothetical protein [Rouxiella badensis]|uniref:hypothetical protein n=1 Tax=Rouxiella badensis TaxID=1646377 RepID=UPI001F0E1640|nr:hypothetical protein [Rouxiella badensis]
MAGTGGAGSAIAHAIAERKPSELTIYNRTQEKSIALINKLSVLFPQIKIKAGTSVPEQVNIAINATSLGMGETLFCLSLLKNSGQGHLYATS